MTFRFVNWRSAGTHTQYQIGRRLDGGNRQAGGHFWASIKASPPLVVKATILVGACLGDATWDRVRSLAGAVEDVAAAKDSPNAQVAHLLQLAAYAIDVYIDKPVVPFAIVLRIADVEGVGFRLRRGAGGYGVGFLDMGVGGVEADVGVCRAARGVSRAVGGHLKIVGADGRGVGDRDGEGDALTLVDRRTEPSDRYFCVYDLNAESDRTCIRATAV